MNAKLDLMDESVSQAQEGGRNQDAKQNWHCCEAQFQLRPIKSTEQAGSHPGRIAAAIAVH